MMTSISISGPYIACRQHVLPQICTCIQSPEFYEPCQQATELEKKVLGISRLQSQQTEVVCKLRTANPWLMSEVESGLKGLSIKCGGMY